MIDNPAAFRAAFAEAAATPESGFAIRCADHDRDIEPTSDIQIWRCPEPECAVVIRIKGQ